MLFVMEFTTPSTTSGSAYSELVTGSFDESKAIEAARRAHEHLGEHATMAFLFVSCDLRESLADLIELVQIHARCPQVVGCSASGLICGEVEDEEANGFSLLVLRLPQTEVKVVSLPSENQGSSWDHIRRWNREGCDGWILLGNPVLLGEEWMDHWNQSIGAVPVYGGLAGGSHRAEDLFLFDQSGVHENASAIAIGLRGGVQLCGLVSQGCRPIGEPFTITKADENLIHQLASQSAYEQLQSTFHNLTEKQRERAQGNILIGLAMSEYVEDFNTGDFLVRSILGGDPDKGAIAVGALPRVGQTLQFQLRDREAASADLHYSLEKCQQQLTKAPFATLLFSCGGRGKHLFGRPHHDASQFAATFGATPLAGFFCNGEIGTIGDKAYLHGFTASAVILANK
jgi:small ligand-binding sensory domain FIST